MENPRTRRLAFLAFAISTILGGNNAIAVRFSNTELPPFFGAGVRFSAASLLLFAAVLIMRLPLPKGRALAGLFIYGVLQFGISYALLYWSLLHVQAVFLQLVLALVPLLTMVFALLHRQETFKWRMAVGGLICVAGIAVIFSDQLSANVSLLPLFAIVAAAACFAEAGVLFKSFPKAHPVTTNAFSMAVGAVILFTFSLLWRETISMPTLTTTWIAVSYLVVLGSVGVFVLLLFVLSHWTATATSYQLVIMPVVTVLFATWLADEKVTIAFLFGGVFVLAGVYIGAVAPPNLLKQLSGSRARTANPEDVL